jgi:DNA-binding beta-propeller fold protein YncE
VPLDGWKDIAKYLGTIHWRTAQRWEKDGLPVHRAGQTGKVFAYRDELDRWRDARTDAAPLEIPGPPGDPQQAVVCSLAIPTRQPHQFLWWEILALAVIAASVSFAIKLLPGHTEPAPLPPIGRLLPRSTSDGWHPKQVQLSHRPTYLAISPRGDKLFATDYRGRTLSILSTKNNSVSTVALPQDAGPLAVSRNGELYIGSTVEGVMVLDVNSWQPRPRIIPTGGRVLGMAITPDGDQLYLAMSMKGLKRLSTRPENLAVVSDRICPEHLELDRQGKRLYVAYQCSGPIGQPGHDSVEIFDLEKEISLGIVTGPPMVGGQPYVSPDGKLVLLDGLDACSAPRFHYDGCKSAPSRVFHLLRTSDRRILRPFEFPVGTSPARFLDNSRFMLLGNEVSVVDAARYSILERWNNAGDCDATDIAFAPDGRRAYVGCSRNNTVLVLQPEGAACSPAQPGLAMLYSADGTNDDAVGVTELTPHGNPEFAPGRVGQAFLLDGSSYLSTSWTGDYEYGFHDSTLALYVKFGGLEGEMVLADWTTEDPRRGIRLLKSTGNRFVFQSWPNGSPLESKTSVRPDTWYHLVVTRTDQHLTLYVNGEPESRGTPPQRLNAALPRSLFLGAQSGKPSFLGWLDEIAFYNRALTAKEVQDLYQLRESGPCKL